MPEEEEEETGPIESDFGSGWELKGERGKMKNENENENEKAKGKERERNNEKMKK